jgi:hypothetical protein
MRKHGRECVAGKPGDEPSMFMDGLDERIEVKLQRARENFFGALLLENFLLRLLFAEVVVLLEPSSKQLGRELREARNVDEQRRCCEVAFGSPPSFLGQDEVGDKRVHVVGFRRSGNAASCTGSSVRGIGVLDVCTQSSRRRSSPD